MDSQHPSPHKDGSVEVETTQSMLPHTKARSSAPQDAWPNRTEHVLVVLGLLMCVEHWARKFFLSPSYFNWFTLIGTIGVAFYVNESIANRAGFLAFAIFSTWLHFSSISFNFGGVLVFLLPLSPK